MSGRRRLLKQTVSSDSAGTLDINFELHDNPRELFLIAHDEKKENSVTIPVILKIAKNPDIQFLPEGGSLVANLPAHIGFKAIDEAGRGIDVAGNVTDHNNRQVAAFQSTHRGMGSFDLFVQPGESYTAKVEMQNGIIKEYPLPKIKDSGTVLHIINSDDKDSVTVMVSATSDLVKTEKGYFIIGKSRGIICYAAVLNFNGRNSFVKNIAKRLFPTGVTHFVLSNEKSISLNERLVFINHKDNLHIQFANENQVSAPHDSVALQLTVRDNKGTPVTGNFSLAVTDDAQVKPDTVNNETILTRLLLTDELKGYVEQPGYYIKTANAKSWNDLDNLLLTQGWVNFDWKIEKQQPVFEKEDEIVVKGKVINAFNNPVKATHVTLLSKSPLLVKDTVTDANGNFVFHDFPDIETPVFFLKAVNKRNKSNNVNIVMNDIKSPAFTPTTRGPTSPLYLNIDTTLLKTAKNNRIRQKEYINQNSHILKEVKITAKKVVKGSQNLNGAGNSDLVLDEKDMIKAGKKSLFDILQEQIGGFRTGSMFGENQNLRYAVQGKTIADINFEANLSQQYETGVGVFMWYFVDDKPIVFIIDGVTLTSSLNVPDLSQPNIDALTDYLQSNNAEDIKGIELISSQKYSSAYFKRYILDDWQAFLSSFDFAFIEITTRSGKGPFVANKTPGTYLYKPLGLTWPKQYYKPKYAINDTTRHLPDSRSTIDWEPNIQTDKNGQATVSFFAAGNPSTYTVIVEGTDGDGNIGYETEKIVISPAKSK